ncbi:DEAD/DEAH box helicase, partial [bacterium]
SGKSLPSIAYALHACRREPMARALFIYPTKALAQDQLAKIGPLAKALGVSAAIYDGDTPPSRRAAIRKTAAIVLTNPDMLHVGILPAHALWGKFLRALRLVVVDEMHVYGGVFGSHVAGVLRRLLRLCRMVHARPQVVAASATVRDPGDMLFRLTGRKGQIVNDDAAPRGSRTLLMYETPIGKGRGLPSELFASLVRSGRRTLAFSRSRLETELLLRETRLALESENEAAGTMIEGYRGGYTPKERRQIENRLFTGDLVGLATTNALELGIDVGTLDAVLLNGFPGRVSSFWQQVGRVARGGRDGTAIFVARPDALETHLLRHPYLILDADIEPIHLNPGNERILARQLLCAAYESPLVPSELEEFLPNALDVAEALDRAGELSFQNGRFLLATGEPPAMGTSLRSGEGETFRLLLEGEELGTMEGWRAMVSAHPGAIYLHRGETYRVAVLDLENHTAHVEPTAERIFTQSQVQTTVTLRSIFQDAPAGEGELALAPMQVQDAVVGYRTRSLDTYELIGTMPLDLPPREFDTAGVVVAFPPPGPDEDPLLFAAGLHACEHALLALAPLFAGCDPNDL